MQVLKHRKEGYTVQNLPNKAEILQADAWSSFSTLAILAYFGVFFFVIH